VAQTVLGYPTSLGTLTFDSPIHTAVDWVRLRGAYPGADVRVADDRGTVVGTGVADGPASARVKLVASINAGSQLRAVQRVKRADGTVVESSPAGSVPAEEFDLENVAAPTVRAPPTECDGAIVVADAIPGCTLTVSTAHGELIGDAVAQVFWFGLDRPARPGDSFSAKNVLQRIGRTVFSPNVPPVGVTALAGLPPPVISLGPSCAAMQFLWVEEVRPGCELRVELLHGGETIALGRGGGPAIGTSVVLNLPDLTQYATNPVSAQVRVVESACGKTAASRPWDVGPAGQWPRPDVLAPLAACANFVFVYSTLGYVELHSDAADWAVVSSPAAVSAHEWVETNRPLRGGEAITAHMLTGCTKPSERDSSPPMPVAAATPPNVKVRGPLRPGQANVIVDATAGGEVHVYVNGHWRGESTALGTDGSATVYVGTLHDEEQVTAREALCSLGPMSGPEPVRTGTIKLAVQPARVTVGTDVDFVFDARDAETDASLWGQIMLNGKPFTFGSNPGRLHIDGSPLRFTIALPGYKSASVEVIVEQPHRPLPPPPPAHGSNLFAQSVWVVNDGTVSPQRNEWVGSGEGFTVDVGNAGPDAAGAFKVSFAVDGDDDGDESVPGLPANTSTSVSRHFPSQSDGSHDIDAEIDSEHVLDDPQRQNNHALATVRVG
jgi:hypothetical protein